LSALVKLGEPSLGIWATDYLKRSLVLLAASYFECQTRAILESYVKTHSGTDIAAAFLLKSMDKQYHTYFDWENRSANKFFSLFGIAFKKEVLDDIKRDARLEEGISAFLEIGDTRNKLVHEGIVGLALNPSHDDFYSLYKRALYFLDYLKTKFN